MLFVIECPKYPKANDAKKPRSNILLSGSILSSSIFIGSTFLYSVNETASIAGMIGALFVMGIFAVFRKH